MASGCGSCTLCCTVMKVDMYPPKPWHTPCGACSKQGCEMYADRPQPCRDFQCLWLASQDLAGVTPMPAAMRPDRSSVVMEVNNSGTLIAHCHRPQAWRREPTRGFLLSKIDRGHVMIDDGRDTWLLAGDGATRHLTKIGVDPDTNNAVYAPTDELARNPALMEKLGV